MYISLRENDYNGDGYAMYKNNIWGEYTMYEFPSNQICIIDPFVIYIYESSLLKDRVSIHGMSIYPL